MSELSSQTKVKVACVAIVATLAGLFITYERPWPELGSPDFTIDPKFGIPEPPTTTPYSRRNNIVACIVTGLLGSLGLARGLYDLITTKSALVMCISLSGALGAFPEVFYDVMGLVYYPWEPSMVAYKILGREMPWWIIFGWWGYGASSVLVYRTLLSNPNNKTIWGIWLGLAIGDVVMEECMLPFDIYHYYGNQPLVILNRLPWWWVPCNTVGCFLATSLVFKYRHALQGWRSIFALFSAPASIAGVYGFIALPGWIVVNGNYGWFLTQLGGLAVIVLGFFAFYFVVDLVLDRDPFDLDGFPRGKHEYDEERSPLLRD